MPSFIFQDDDIIAVDKPEGLSAIAERNIEKDCLLTQLSALFRHKVYVVHRLDKDASGVILFAKNAGAHRCLCQQFAKHTIKKTYLALVHGQISGDGGTIEKPLRQFGSGRVAVDIRYGKPAVTEFEVAQRFTDCTLVLAHPVTGRRHQLRVHFYSIGHPIVGDKFYGDKNPPINWGAKYVRLMLHAEKITFQLPSGRQITLQAPPPQSFTDFVEDIGKFQRHH